MDLFLQTGLILAAKPTNECESETMKDALVRLRNPRWRQAGLVVFIVALLIAVSKADYILFHGIAEVFTVAVAWAVLLVAWNTRHMAQNGALLSLGVGLFFTGLLHVLHAVAYRGTGYWPEAQASNVATQLWMAARFLETLALLSYSLLLNHRAAMIPLAAGYAALFVLLAASVFWWGVFPTCYAEGSGLTTFKKAGEYAVCIAVAVAASLLARRRTSLDPRVFRLLLASMALTVAAELAFCFYVNVYGASNLAGHLFKIAAFALIYMALVRSSLQRPLDTLFARLERQRSALQESEERLRLANKATRDVIWDWDIARGVQRWSESGTAVFGWTDIVDASQSTSWWVERVHDEDRSRLEEEMASALSDRTRLSWEGEYRFRKADGIYAHVVDRANILRDAGGTAIRMVGAMQDISDRKLREEQARGLARLMEAVRRAQSMVMFSKQPAAAFADILDEFLAVAAIAGGFLDVFSSGPRVPPRRRLAQRNWQDGSGATAVPPDAPFPEPSPQRPTEIPLRFAGEHIGTIGLSGACPEAQAFSAFLQACGDLAHAFLCREQEIASTLALRDSEARYALVLRGANGEIWDWDPKARCMGHSDKLFALRGLRSDGCTDSDREWESRIHPKDRARVMEEVRAALAGESSLFVAEYRVQHTDGNWRWIRDTGAVQRDSQGRPIRMAGSEVDITDSVRAEEDLRTFKRIAESADFGTAIADMNHVLVFVNRSFAKSHGWEREDLLGWSIARLHTPDQMPQVERLLEEVLTKGGFTTQEVEHCRRDGTRMSMLMTGVLIRDFDDEPAYIGVTAVDLTEKMAMEERYRHAQKLEAVGQLAGGVAHDFRNQLTVIKGYAEMLLRRGLAKDKGPAMLEEILKAAERSTVLTGQLLAFSRKQTLAVQRVDVVELVADLCKSLSHMVGEDVQVSVVPWGEPCPVETDPWQVQQAAMNLIANARDAMPKGGHLSIETFCGPVPPHLRQEHPEAGAGPYVVLAIRDTGCGMDADTKARVFEPFFTTKEVGRGTGLGLSMVYGFMKQSEGFVHVESAPGCGAAFSLYFPRSRDGAVGSQGSTGVEAPVSGGTESILVVEDEPGVKELLAQLLREGGYTVLEASTVAQAMETLARADRVDMVVSDVVMPGGSGLELAERISQVHPGVKLLFVSGYATDELDRRGLRPAPSDMLAKPYTRATVLGAIRAKLGSGDTDHAGPEGNVP